MVFSPFNVSFLELRFFSSKAARNSSGFTTLRVAAPWAPQLFVSILISRRFAPHCVTRKGREGGMDTSLQELPHCWWSRVPLRVPARVPLLVRPSPRSSSQGGLTLLSLVTSLAKPSWWPVAGLTIRPGMSSPLWYWSPGENYSQHCGVFHLDLQGQGSKHRPKGRTRLSFLFFFEEWDCWALAHLLYN